MNSTIEGELNCQMEEISKISIMKLHNHVNRKKYKHLR
jgi:hypothetical protein